MRHLLIDANAYLEFYKFSSDDLEELRKLEALLRSDELDLYLTNQIRDEVLRNREKVIADSLRKAQGEKASSGFPQMIRNYSAFKKLETARKEYTNLLSKLVERATKDALDHALDADKLLKSLFETAECIEATEADVQLAIQRYNRGNPPGKNHSYGDAITWECILDEHPAGEDLHFITADRDFLSPLDESRLHEFLATEWTEKKQSQVHIYPTMTAFFRKRYPDITLADEVETELAIGKLVGSSNFVTTHKAIATLAEFRDFTDSQVATLAEAALSNSQITYLLQDPDVNVFYKRLIEDFGDAIGSDIVAELTAALF